MSAHPSSTVLSASDDPPPRKLRKGTHSCVECRRRKKSCVPRSATPGSCEECHARGVECRSQEISLGTKRRSPAGGNLDLQQRVAELEAALLSVTQKLGTTPEPVEPDNSAAKVLQELRREPVPFTPVTSPESDTEALLKHAPVLSLFDNAILSALPDDSVREDTYGATTTLAKAKSDSNPALPSARRRLLALFPPRQALDAILSDSYFWWACWLEIYPHFLGLGINFNAVEFIAGLKESDSVQKMAKALLCLVLILQEKRQDDKTSGGMSGRFDEIVSTIDETVLSDDELAGTIDGVECLVLRSKFELNSGRVRKTWLTQRRGIALAELAGIPKRPAHNANDVGQSVRRESIWKVLYLSDRYLSLLLGLPYGPTDMHSGFSHKCGPSAKEAKNQDSKNHYSERLASIMGHIIDRNQQLPSNDMLPLTFKIEGELMELAASMESDWWRKDFEPGPTGQQIYLQLLPQFWHHQARTFLHLPFMLKAATDRRFEYNRTATLESAREMIACYRVVRPAMGFGSLVCKMIDFLVFTGAMILVLNLLEHYAKGHYARGEVLNHREADKDQELILITTSLLQRASVETNGLVANQAARALEMFSDIKGLFSSPQKMDEPCTTKVVIPFFGTVVFEPGARFKEHCQSQKPERMLPPRQLPTPSDQSQESHTPNTAPANNTVMEPMIPFDFGTGENSKDTGVNGDILADVNFDLDQEWSWFWDNIDIPSMDWQGTGT